MNNATISNAIRSRVEIEFVYDSEARVVRPHILFESEDGNVVLGGIQPGKRWRNFDVDGISRLVVTDRQFQKDPGFNRNSPVYHRVLCSL